MKYFFTKANSCSIIAASWTRHLVKGNSFILNNTVFYLIPQILLQYSLDFLLTNSRFSSLSSCLTRVRSLDSRENCFLASVCVNSQVLHDLTAKPTPYLKPPIHWAARVSHGAITNAPYMTRSDVPILNLIPLLCNSFSVVTQFSNNLSTPCFFFLSPYS